MNIFRLLSYYIYAYYFSVCLTSLLFQKSFQVRSGPPYSFPHIFYLLPIKNLCRLVHISLQAFLSPNQQRQIIDKILMYMYRQNQLIPSRADMNSWCLHFAPVRDMICMLQITSTFYYVLIMHLVVINLHTLFNFHFLVFLMCSHCCAIFLHLITHINYFNNYK